MKIAKWLIALVAISMFVGCAKSDEEKAEDDMNQMMKDVKEAVK